MMSGYDAVDFFRDADVSRETCERLQLFAKLLKRWNTRINLVSRDSMDDLWLRHMADSAQLRDVIPEYDGALVDVGSGAGFPGMVLAIMGLPNVHLVESNARKCDFLREAARLTGCAATIHNIRLGEKSEPIRMLPKAGIVTARAVSSLTTLLDIVYPIMYDRTCCIFHKGSRVDDELKAARDKWRFGLERIPSKSNPSGAIVKLRNIRRLERFEVKD